MNTIKTIYLFLFGLLEAALLRAVPTNTFQAFQAIGNREDLSDMIYNVSPTATPFQQLVGKEDIDNALTEWQTDSLAAVDGNNAAVEGDDATNNSIAATTRVSNYAQTSTKVAQVSTIQNSAIKKAGRKGTEMAYQMVKRGKELKRDAETILLSNQAPSAGSASTARKLRPLPGWYATNDQRGTSGADGTSSAAATDGTQRDLAESLVKTAMQTAYSNGGEPTVMMVGPVNRVNASSQLLGDATRMYRIEEKKLIATVTVYETDFGPLKIIPNRFQRERDCHLLDPDALAIGYLESPQSQDLAITGLSRRKQIWMTYSLICKNEAAHAVIADLNTSIL
jgi:hypothetical protein